MMKNLLFYDTKNQLTDYLFDTQKLLSGTKVVQIVNKFK